MPEVFTNLGLTTVSSGGTTAPVSGTVETWTVASSASFPAAVTGGNQFRVVEDDQVKQSEIILVTNVSGTTWTVTRGAEGTTPVAHTTGFTIVQTISKGTMDNWLQLDNTQTVTGAKTFAATTTMQTADGSQTLSIRARLTANGGQSAPLMEFRDLNGSAWTSVDTTGNISSLVSISAATLVAGNNLGSQGTLIFNKTGPATSGTTNQNSALSKYRTAYWTGTVSTDDELTLQAIRASTTPGDIDLTLANGRLKVPVLTTTGAVTAGGLLTLSAGAQVVRGQVINLDGSTANTLITSEATAGTAFTGSAVSDLIVKEPNASSILLGTHGTSGIQIPSLKVTSSDVQALDVNGGTPVLRSLPRGVVSRLTAITSAVSLGAAGAEVIAATLSSIPITGGRKYRLVAIYNSVTSSILNDEIVLRLYQGSTQIQSTGRIRIQSANLGYGGGTLEATFTNNVNSTFTFTLRGIRITGTGTSSINAATSGPLEFYIEDVGTT